MAIYRVDIVRPYTTGEGEDVAVNVLHYQYDGAGTPGLAEFGQLRTAITSFFNDVPTLGSSAVHQNLGHQMNVNADASSMRFYRVPDTRGLLGSPEATLSWTPSDGIGTEPSLPAEVAIVLSYNAILTDVPETAQDPSDPNKKIRPASRRRGRMFIGPLNKRVLALGNGVNGPQRPAAQTLTDIRTAAAQFLPGNLPDWSWVVFSPTDWVGRGVVQVSTDNAFDTIRKRGVAPSSRVVLGL